jgi:hypothetical protein
MKLDVMVDEILNIPTHRYGIDGVSELYVYRSIRAGRIQMNGANSHQSV